MIQIPPQIHSFSGHLFQRSNPVFSGAPHPPYPVKTIF
jgi:hypothetical protein